MLRKSILCVMIISVGLVADNQKSKLGLHGSSYKAETESIFTPQQWTGVKVAGGLLATAAVHCLADRIVGSGDGQYFYNGKYAWGFAQALKLSGACLSVAPMLNEEWGDQLYRWGMRAPVIAAGAIVLAHPNTQKLAFYIPLDIGKNISTFEQNDQGTWQSKCGSDCHGICNRCFVPKAVLTVGLYKLADPLLTKMGTAIGQQCGFIKEDSGN